MDRAAPPVESLHALELRVLEGPQGGARAPLSAGVACVLAAEPDGQGAGADIVLREDRVAPVPKNFINIKMGACVSRTSAETTTQQERPSMDRAAPSVESLHALELRVFEGPQGGAARR